MTERRRSVYESRELTWLDRVRGRFRRGEERQEPLLDERGDPTLVVVKGEPIGIRDTRGGIIRFPRLPDDPRQWPESMWEDAGDGGWFRVRRREWWR